MPTADTTLFHCKSGDDAHPRGRRTPGSRRTPVGGAKRCGLAAVLLFAPLLACLAPAAAAATSEEARCLGREGSQAWNAALPAVLFGNPSASHAKALYRTLATLQKHDHEWGGTIESLPPWPARYGTQPTGTITAQEVKTVRGADPWTGWNPIIDALEKLEACLVARQQPDPEVSIAAGAGVTEGGEATFTLTATPPPPAALTVRVKVTQAGSYAKAGKRRVTIPTGGTATLRIPTTGDDVDEADGSVTATLVSRTGYTVAAPPGNAATVAVADDDDPPAPDPEVSIAAGAGVTEGGEATFTLTATPPPPAALTVRVKVTQAGGYAKAGKRRVTIPTGGTATLRIATTDDDVDEADGSVTATLVSRTGYTVAAPPGNAATVAVADDDDPPAPDPEVSIAAGAGVTEGGEATFTLTATPPPPAALTVRVKVTQAGSYAKAGKRQVTIPTGGTATLRIATTGDDVDEADGSVTATLVSRTGYTVAAPPGNAATVAVADDDDPPAPDPEVSIAAGAGVTEGGEATFTLTATPPPSAALTVRVKVTQAGSYAKAGKRQVTIPTGGTATLRIATTGDDVDEADGSVTATLVSRTGYTVAAPPGNAATVAVADDDDPDPVPELRLRTWGSAVVEGVSAAFSITASAAPATHLTIPFTVTQSGEVLDAPGAGQRTVRLRAGRAGVSFTVDTLDDGVVEHDGAVSVTLDAGTGYTVAAGEGSATVTVRDDDLSVVNIAAGGGVTEGTAASFTITASPAPAAPLTVALWVMQRGDYLASGGTGATATTVTVPVSGSVTLEVATVDDSVSEPDGEVIVHLQYGIGYTFGDADEQSVSVADDDPCVSSSLAMQAWNNAKEGIYDRKGIHSPPELYQKRALYRALLTLRRHGVVRLRLPTWPHGWLPTRTITAQEVRMVRDYSWPGWKPVIKALEGLETCLGAGPTSPASAVPCVSSSLGSQAWENARNGIFSTPVASRAKALYRALVTFRQYGVSSRSLPAWPARHGAIPGGIITAKEVRIFRGADPWAGWNPVIEALEKLETCQQSDPPASDPVVWITGGAGVTEGDPASFTVTASPAPAAPITVTLKVSQSGDFAVSGAISSKTVTIPASGSATLSVATMDDAAHEPAGAITATLAAGTGYAVAAAPSDAASVPVADDDPAPTGPTLSIADATFNEDEPGGYFTVTLSEPLEREVRFRYATRDLTPLSAEAGRDYKAVPRASRMLGRVKAGQTRAHIHVTIHEDTLEEDPEFFEMVLFDVDVNAPPGAVPVSVADGLGAGRITRGDPSATGIPTMRVYDGQAHESDRHLTFWIRLSRPMDRRVYVSYQTRHSTPVSAQSNVDYFPWNGSGWFPPGVTELRNLVDIINDGHDEGPETFEIVLTSNDREVRITDGVAVMTILNSDPMPAAWLARFGRTVAEAALDGISGRMTAPRTAGVEGKLAGQALSFGAAGEAANDPAAPGGFSGRGPGTGPGRPPAWSELDTADRFGDDAWSLGESRTITAQELLLGSHFTATGETDAAGGSLAFWGRAAQSTFDGREGTFSLDGETTTGMLGADYARGNWLAGLALMQSSGEGGYADNGAGPQRCPDDGDGMAPDMAAFLCGGAVREGDGTVEASLTAAIPYAAIQASERLKLWGALGYGTGEITLEPAKGGALDSDISWTMAAAGARSDLLPPPAEGSGPALALISDAFWARTRSETTQELAASDSDANRLRLGLEGSWRIATEGDGHLTPKLEIGARHDGGDAETGFGVELGGGLAWSDPALGLSLDLSGRTLIAHGSDDLEDRGFAASMVFDPDPASQRGPSLTLTQDWGGAARGGLDALFAPDPLDRRSGDGEATARWTAEAAYGFPAFGGRFTGSPHVGLGLATATRDYTLGWRLAPAANANAPDLSFGAKAMRRESETAQPEHSIGFEATFRW